MATMRRHVYFNPTARSWIAPPAETTDLISQFHRRLPFYEPTKLVSLDEVAKEIGVAGVYLKDESSRFGLTSFKILGASWGTFRTLVQAFGLSLDTDLATLKQALALRPVTLYTATDGNHGRAVAYMACLLSIPAVIHVPANMHESTIESIRLGGATVVVSTGNYDAAVLDAQQDAQKNGGLLVQDFAFAGYEDIPKWIVDGYQTLMREIDDQLNNLNVDLVITPAGVGSLAQAVVSHYKGQDRSTAVMSVEPDTAGCLWKSLCHGEPIPAVTSHTIMAGLDCGTVSTIAWPILKAGMDASLTVSDYEAHLASLYLNTQGLSPGPCGSAPLAALRRLTSLDKTALGLNPKSVVVLLCTEGKRDHKIPVDVSIEDPVLLTQTLVQIDSANPELSTTPAAGETEIARYITAWLEHRQIECHWIEPTKGRPSLVGVVRGSGGGKSLMLNGHIDTVTTAGYDGNPLSGDIRDGKLYGRGAADMKGGVAAAMIALANAKRLGLRGDVIFTGVADEEYTSIGTEQVLQAGWRADAAIVTEPTYLTIINAHKGFVWVEVDIHGLAAHGSRPDLGIDAISKAGYFLVKLDKYAAGLQAGVRDPTVGPGSCHASIIKGGEEPSSYPAKCTIVVERRTVPGETPAMVKQELESLLEEVAKDVPGFKYDLRVTFDRRPFSMPLNHPFSTLVGGIVGKTLGHKAVFRGNPIWTDSALLADAGIPALLWGPQGVGFHSKEEYVHIDSISRLTEGLTEIARQFCK